MRNNRIEINPKIMVGKPVIKGTRIPVTLILNLLENDYTIEQILEAYPNLTKNDVLAAIGYAKKRIEMETIVYQKAKLFQIKSPQEILKIWGKARGIWKKKKMDSMKYLEKIRKEWKKSYVSDPKNKKLISFEEVKRKLNLP